jgi:hypothetical protein
MYESTDIKEKERTKRSRRAPDQTQVTVPESRQTNYQRKPLQQGCERTVFNYSKRLLTMENTQTEHSDPKGNTRAYVPISSIASFSIGFPQYQTFSFILLHVIYTAKNPRFVLNMHSTIYLYKPGRSGQAPTRLSPLPALTYPGLALADSVRE